MLFGFGVLLSLAALTVDVGNINADRRQLQNGADAVALAVAQKCATTGTCAAYDGAGVLDPSLQALVNANAADGKTEIRRVDGTTDGKSNAVCGTGKGLVACPTSSVPNTQNLQECPSLTLPATAKYVRVYTETKNGAGDRILPYSFGAAITGISGANQQACANVVWGPVSGAPVAFPVTFSYCDWMAVTGAKPSATPPVPGATQPPPAAGLAPGYGTAAAVPPNTLWPVVGSEVTLWTQAHGATPCTTWNGHTAPGNFGTLKNTSCLVTIDGEWAQADSGNDIPCNEDAKTNPPDPKSLNAQVGHIIYVPIFDCFTKTKGSFANCSDGANNDWFHISGYAPFYLTGYYFSSSKFGDSIFPPTAGKAPCKGGDRCVSGWFTTGMLQTSIDISGAPDFGGTAIQVNG